MVKYECEKCGKVFDQKYNYIRHLNRKNPCAEQHKPVQSNENNKLNLLIAKLEEVIEDNKLLKKDNDVLRKEIKKLKKNQNCR